MNIDPISGITTFSDFIALSCMAHIFWPNGSYRHFFHSDLMMHRTVSNTSGDSEEFDTLMMTSLNSDDEVDSFQ
jgi:hypothetical protein